MQQRVCLIVAASIVLCSFTTCGQRLFNAVVEQNVVNDIDICQLGGGEVNKAVNKISSAAVDDGLLTIELQPIIENPTIAAIEVNRVGEATAASATSAAPPTPFPTILLNCGGLSYNDTQGRLWKGDMFFQGGASYYNSAHEISGTVDDAIYQGERWGTFSYSIPIPKVSSMHFPYWQQLFHQTFPLTSVAQIGRLRFDPALCRNLVSLPSDLGSSSFSELTYRILAGRLLLLSYSTAGARLFDIKAQGELLASNFDIWQQAGGQAFKAITRETPVTVLGTTLTIEFVTKLDNPKISGIEVRRIGPHYAHAVAGGPYVAADTKNDGNVMVQVDASQSHTHGPGQVLTSFTWRSGPNILGSDETTVLSLPVGTHDISLTVVDSAGDISVDRTTVTVNPGGYPVIASLYPTTGDVAGGSDITISGQSFTTTSQVLFGLVTINDNGINVLNSTTLIVKSPVVAIGAPVSVSVIASVGESNKATFTYVNASPVSFISEKVLDMPNPTAAAFGPDGKLYVGTTHGKLGRFTLNDSYDKVLGSVIAELGTERGIHGIAFDPLETAERGTDLTVYVATADIFHGESKNSFGKAINGKIQAVRGANLEVVVDIVVGLPVSDLDHSVS
jgi:Malectin domain/IPT/TIG domain